MTFTFHIMIVVIPTSTNKNWSKTKLLLCNCLLLRWRFFYSRPIKFSILHVLTRQTNSRWSLNNSFVLKDFLKRKNFRIQIDLQVDSVQPVYGILSSQPQICFNNKQLSWIDFSLVWVIRELLEKHKQLKNNKMVWCFSRLPTAALTHITNRLLVMKYFSMKSHQLSDKNSELFREWLTTLSIIFIASSNICQNVSLSK